MRTEGLVKSWNDDRGFGFIEPIHGGQEIFVHIKAFPPRAGRPRVGQYVCFEIEQNKEGKKRAKNVELLRAVRSGAPRRFNATSDWGTVSLLAIPAFLFLYGIVAVLWRVPNLVAGAYFLLSVACFAAYAADKSAAKSEGRHARKYTPGFGPARRMARRTTRAAAPSAQVTQSLISERILVDRRYQYLRVRRT